LDVLITHESDVFAAGHREKHPDAQLGAEGACIRENARGYRLPVALVSAMDQPWHGRGSSRPIKLRTKPFRDAAAIERHRVVKSGNVDAHRAVVESRDNIAKLAAQIGKRG